MTALEKSDFFREAFGSSFVDYLCTMKRSELGRYHDHVRAQDAPSEYAENVTEWEQREYFELF